MRQSERRHHAINMMNQELPLVSAKVASLGLAIAMGFAACGANAQEPTMSAEQAAGCPPQSEKMVGSDILLRTAKAPIDIFAKIDQAALEKIASRATAKNAEQQAKDFGNLCRYQAANAARTARPDVVLFGDSITELWKIARPEFFQSGKIQDRGIGGQTSSQALLRFRQDVLDLRPRMVQIMLGTNDIGGSPASLKAVQDNIQNMVELAKMHRIKVVLGTIPPAVFRYPRLLDARDKVAVYNLWLRSYAREARVKFADYHGVLAAPDGRFAPMLSNDGVHPNRAGYAAMQTVLERASR